MHSLRFILKAAIAKHVSNRINKIEGLQAVEGASRRFPTWVAVAASVGLVGLSGATALAEGTAERPSPSPGDIWEKWDQVKRFLSGWQRPEHGADVPLPVDKLACHLPKGVPVVLVSCGSFNPPTLMHVRMLELARQWMRAQGCDVLGAYLSPVNDAYWKRDLVPGRHRVELCKLAAAGSDFVMVDAWEVEQMKYTRTLNVLQHLQRRLFEAFSPPQGKAALPPNCDATDAPRVVLVCGADVLQSMEKPEIWRQDLLETLLSQHGVVCISRDDAGVDAIALLERPGTLLHRFRNNVAVVTDPVPNQVSSSAVRKELEAGRSVAHLVVPEVEAYIRRHGLYGTGKEKK